MSPELTSPSTEYGPVHLMTRDELRAWAKAEKLAGYSKLNAPELRTAVANELLRRRDERLRELMHFSVVDRLTDQMIAANDAFHGLHNAFGPMAGMNASAQRYVNSRTPARFRR
jgi:hypothetical protein